MKNLRKKASALKGFSRWAAFVSGISILVIVLYTTADVTGRQVANRPLPGTFELSLVLIIFVVYFGLAYTQARGRHLRLEFIWQRFSPRGKAICDILALLIGLLLFILITWQASVWSIVAWQTKSYMQGIFKMPYFPSTLGFAIGSFLLCIQYVIDLTQHIGQLLGKDKIKEQR